MTRAGRPLNLKDVPAELQQAARTAYQQKNPVRLGRLVVWIRPDGVVMVGTAEYTVEAKQIWLYDGRLCYLALCRYPCHRLSWWALPPVAGGPMTTIQPLISTHRPWEASGRLNSMPAQEHPLGGPLSTRGQGHLQRVSEEALPELHLKYLRRAYLQDPTVRELLTTEAASFRYGHNHLSVISPYPAVGENIIMAIRGIARTLQSRI